MQRNTVVLTVTDFLNGYGDNDGNGKVAEGVSNDSGDDAAAGGDGKRKVGCGEEADHDGGDNNGGVAGNRGVDINIGNDANGNDGMSKSIRDDDANGGGGNSNDNGSIHENGVFDNKG